MTARNELSTVRKVVFGQVLMAALVASGFLLIGGWKNAVSPLLGGLLALLPNLYFAYKIYLARDLGAQGILNAFYTGESIKLVLTAALFSVVVQIPGVDFLTLMAGYVAVLSVFWFALFWWRD